MQRNWREHPTVLDGDPGVTGYVAYVGSGSPRFYLPLDQQLTQTHFAQFVVLTQGPAEREALLAYAIADAGSDWMQWHVRDIATVAAECGVITTAEAEVMRRRNHLRDIVVRVDDFPFDYNVATANKPAQSRLAA